MKALLGLVLLVAFAAPNVETSDACPRTPPVDGAACTRVRQICVYRERGVACVCARPSSEPAAWSCGEYGE